MHIFGSGTPAAPRAAQTGNSIRPGLTKITPEYIRRFVFSKKTKWRARRTAQAYNTSATGGKGGGHAADLDMKIAPFQILWPKSKAFKQNQASDDSREDAQPAVIFIFETPGRRNIILKSFKRRKYKCARLAPCHAFRLPSTHKTCARAAHCRIRYRHANLKIYPGTGAR